MDHRGEWHTEHTDRLGGRQYFLLTRIPWVAMSHGRRIHRYAAILRITERPRNRSGQSHTHEDGRIVTAAEKGHHHVPVRRYVQALAVVTTLEEIAVGHDEVPVLHTDASDVAFRPSISRSPVIKSPHRNVLFLGKSKEWVGGTAYNSICTHGCT